MKLKTLKDLEKEHEKYTYEDSLVTGDELRQEAIKHYKDLRDYVNKRHGAHAYSLTTRQMAGAMDWIKYFFNISEEELK